MAELMVVGVHRDHGAPAERGDLLSLLVDAPRMGTGTYGSRTPVTNRFARCSHEGAPLCASICVGTRGPRRRSRTGQTNVERKDEMSILALRGMSRREARVALLAAIISGGLAGCGEAASTAVDSGTPVADGGAPSADGGAPADDGGAPANDSGVDDGGLTAADIRDFIDRQIPGGIEMLMVPATDTDIPVPPAPEGYAGRFDTTEAKAYLGRLLFHDPVRAQRIDINEGQPLDFPRSTAFGGTIGVSDSPDGPPPAGTFATAQQSEVDRVVRETIGTASCGSCHIGEAAGKAGQAFNFAAGGEGRGYTDADGNFVPRRRASASLIPVRRHSLFPGDTFVDALPTLTDIFRLPDGQRVVTTPALFYHMLPPPAGLELLQSGRLDQLDSVARQSPSMIGFAFNNRLLFGGFAGEPSTSSGSLQPSSILLDPAFDDPAQENLTFLLLDAHRMLGAQAATLQSIPSFVQAFREAFPAEAAAADAAGDMNVLINDFTVARATATFLRTTVTRSTPFDEFLAGDDTAMTPAQLRGARLFFTSASEGGANCFACHSGPMLNKQPDDPDLAGIGAFVEENFINVGIGDHPLQALNALAHGRSTTHHAEDTGRAEITGRDSDRYRFRSLTLRQLRDARTFFHNGAFTSVRDVVEYFNEGVPADAVAGAEPTLDSRFTSPRGTGTRGLGLTDAQIDDLTDFLGNGLYDPTFAERFNLRAEDLNYSGNHPTLAAAGATDGVLLGGGAMDSDDPLSRRDQGLEFLDVTNRVVMSGSTSGTTDTWVITNTSSSVIDTHLLVIVTRLAGGVTVTAPERTTGVALPGGTSSGEPPGEPYFRLFLPDGVLYPGQSVSVDVPRTGGSLESYTLRLLSGQGDP